MLQVLDGHSKLETGGHNPKDPGGDFNPNNPKPSTALKAGAAIVATAVFGAQIGGNEDARKDLENEDLPTPIVPEKKEDISFLDQLKKLIEKNEKSI